MRNVVESAEKTLKDENPGQTTSECETEKKKGVRAVSKDPGVSGFMEAKAAKRESCQRGGSMKRPPRIRAGRGCWALLSVAEMGPRGGRVSRPQAREGNHDSKFWGMFAALRRKWR